MRSSAMPTSREGFSRTGTPSVSFRFNRTRQPVESRPRITTRVTSRPWRRTRLNAFLLSSTVVAMPPTSNASARASTRHRCLLAVPGEVLGVGRFSRTITRPSQIRAEPGQRERQLEAAPACDERVARDELGRGRLTCARGVCRCDQRAERRRTPPRGGASHATAHVSGRVRRHGAL